MLHLVYLVATVQRYLELEFNMFETLYVVLSFTAVESSVTELLSLMFSEFPLECSL